MNEFYEAVSNLFEELRCDSGEREYTVQPEEWKEAEKNLKQIQKKLPLHLEKIPEREQNFWNIAISAILIAPSAAAKDS